MGSNENELPKWSKGQRTWEFMYVNVKLTKL
jgi:hypothetical protein